RAHGLFGFQFGKAYVQVGNEGVQLLDVGANVRRSFLKEVFRWQRHPVHARQSSKKSLSGQTDATITLSARRRRRQPNLAPRADPFHPGWRSTWASETEASPTSTAAAATVTRPNPVMDGPSPTSATKSMQASGRR